MQMLKSQAEMGCATAPGTALHDAKPQKIASTCLLDNAGETHGPATNLRAELHPARGRYHSARALGLAITEVLFVYIKGSRES